MRKFVLLAFFLLMGVLASVAQKAEVLYFKAELACCQAKACDAIEADVKAIVDKNFDDEMVTFKEVKLAEASNKELVEIHKAKSQTVVIVAKKKKKETIVDVSDIVRNYSRSRNKAVFETELLAKINESIK